MLATKETNCYKPLVILLLSLCLVQSNIHQVLANPEMIDLKVIAMLESSGGKHLIGDGGNSLGMHQLSADVIAWYNRCHNTSYSHKDALDSTISAKVARWYVQERIPQMLRAIKKPVTAENILTCYNAGCKAVKTGRVPKSTRQYIAKYKRLKAKQ